MHAYTAENGIQEKGSNACSLTYVSMELNAKITSHCNTRYMHSIKGNAFNNKQHYVNQTTDGTSTHAYVTLQLELFNVCRPFRFIPVIGLQQ